MTQEVHPEVVISAPGWTGSVADIGEVVRNDATRMRSVLAPNGTQPLVFRFEALEVPSADTGHSFAYVIWKNQAAGAEIDVLVELIEGPLGGSETVIDSWTHTNIDETANLFTQTLDAGDVAGIDDASYLAGLYVRITPTQEVAATAPTVVSFDESVIPAGRVLTITGTNFVNGATSVWFGSTEVPAGSVTFNSATEIEVAVPAIVPGTYTVEAETADGLSTNGEQITVPALVRNIIAATPPAAHIEDTGNTTSYAGAATEALSAYARVLAWIANADADTAETASLSGWGLTWTQRETLEYQPGGVGTFHRLSLFTTTTGVGGASADELTVTFSENQTGLIAEVVEYVFSPACPFVPNIVQDEVHSANTTTADGTPHVETLAALGPNPAVGAAFVLPRNGPSLTPDSGWTNNLDRGIATPNHGLALLGAIGTTDNTPGGSWVGSTFIAIGVEVG